VVGIFGDEDRAVPVSVAKEFDKALADGHVDHVVKIFEHSKHGFADSTREEFNPKTGPEANSLALDFLKKHLQLKF